MSKKKRKFEKNLHPATAYIEKLTLRDLKRECVVRGMPFEEVVRSTVPMLNNWFRDNFHNKTNHSLLDQYDDWWEIEVKAAAEKRGEPVYLHPMLRLGYIAEKDSDGNVTKKKRVKVIIAKKKVKRERTEEGLFSGTKKAYTYKLQKDGKSKEETISLVMAQFPEASEKSIGIWFNKSKKEGK